MKVTDNKRKGSITVEAAIVLPVFLCVVISVVSLIKVVYTHEMIQFALSETVDEMASSAYLFRISGLQDLNSSINEGLKQNSQLFENQIDAYGNLNGILVTGESVLSNPMEELKSIAAYIAKGGYGDIKTELLNPLVRIYMKKYLSSGTGQDVNEKLKALNIRNGFEGLDFDKSKFFINDNEDIDIIVEYTIDLPIPLKIIPKLVLVQRASAKAWLGGDDASPIINENTNAGEDIWSLDNFSRGRLIRSRFGANLPLSFPVIAYFEAGKAIMIKSLDTTAESYQTGDTLMKTLDGYISSMAKYKGQEEPWGSKNIIIREDELLQKEILLVIPENEVTPYVRQILDECSQRASVMGVRLVIERYGTKNINVTDENG